MRRNYLPSLSRMPLSTIFHALSDPARLKIVRCLIESEEVGCGAFKLPMAKSSMSHHFKVLREAGLIRKREDGTRQFISLRRPELEARCEGLLEMIRGCAKPD